MAAIDEVRPAGPAACPRCGTADRVEGVPAAYLAAKARYREEVGTGEDQKVTISEENSALALALAPAPPEPSDDSTGCTAIALILVGVGTFIWGAVAGKWFDRDGARRLVPEGDGAGRVVVEPAYEVLGWVSGGAFALGVLVLFVTARLAARRRRRMSAGRDAADRVWSAAWYCARCGSVHFAADRPVSLHAFRTQVWTAGGYGDEVARHPVP
ncbi:hypothetical protein [Streptomyces subrutilus]|uniref:hypothetical protein n=1 Tax=Streptomyces subrutilus TaxID=36818 RepID=UPI002E14B4BB|nr:hypothetical protein OG479_04905 [Streptomyces subrutilus]